MGFPVLEEAKNDEVWPLSNQEAAPLALPET